MQKTYLFLFIVMLISWCDKAHSQKLFVGLAEGNITPPIGYPHYRGISTGVHDSLFAKAIYFKQAGQQAVLVECDLLWISRPLSTDVRMSIQEKTDIPYQNIIIAGTHSHTTPAYDEDIMEISAHIRDTLKIPVSINENGYNNWLRNQMVQTVIKAQESSTPAQLEIGQGNIKDISFNRRFLMNDGKAMMNPGFQNPAAIEPLGPVDPEVGIVMVKNEDDSAKGMFINFANHADTKEETEEANEFSADFPAVLSQILSKSYESGFITIYGQGACGNINHFNVNDIKESQLTSEEIGEKLADEVKDQVLKLQSLPNPSLAVKSKVIHVPLQDFTEEELTWAIDSDAAPLYNESNFYNRRRRMKIGSLQRMRENEAVPPTVPSGTWNIPLEIQVFRISDELAIVGLPGELFVEHGLAIKQASPFKLTMVIELTNSYIAYVPTKEAFKQGSYETINSRLAPGGGEMMVKTAIELLKSLH